MSSEPGVSDVVLHPVRLRVIQALGGRELTTGQIRDLLPDVAQATLYRHVAALVEAGFVQVVAERPVRGAVERTYALGERMAHAGREELESMADAQLKAAFLMFLSSLGENFDRLLESNEPEWRDYLGFGTGVIHLDSDDLVAFQEGFDKLLAPYRDEAPGKRRVALSTVVLRVV